MLHDRIVFRISFGIAFAHIFHLMQHFLIAICLEILIQLLTSRDIFENNSLKGEQISRRERIRRFANRDRTFAGAYELATVLIRIFNQLFYYLSLHSDSPLMCLHMVSNRKLLYAINIKRL